MFIDHIGIAVANYKESLAFYTQALAPLDLELIMEVEGWGGIGKGEKAEFWFGEEVDGVIHPPMHLAFVAETREMVDQFYSAAITAGAKDNGKPGIREIYHPNYYGAFVIDLNGHNLEAVCHLAE